MKIYFKSPIEFLLVARWTFRRIWDIQIRNIVCFFHLEHVQARAEINEQRLRTCVTPNYMYWDHAKLSGLIDLRLVDFHNENIIAYVMSDSYQNENQSCRWNLNSPASPSNKHILNNHFYFLLPQLSLLPPTIWRKNSKMNPELVAMMLCL